ncbi:hypothetical protein EI427_06060 [Flammeovirga pectinis]|uniref:Uncharacterized protein n=1 Tax=Flammeovirga pectinis TaxID=2494373 RepID=A0A3S9P0W9_9BACT|nr:hypothetical protein [Flammeovirga pectinis]AZQ61815.1 hypothetical protein EI427_06060 [Flammeovirga pectinis]
MTMFKNIIGLVLVFLMTIACDPLKEINDSIDDGRSPVTSDYTFTEDDYGLSCNADVQKFMSFSKAVPPDNDTCGVAQVLNQKFYGVSGDIMNTTYNYFNSLYKGTTIPYTATQSDYDRFGGFGSLSLNSSIQVCDSVFTLLNGSPAVKSDVVSLTATYYENGNTTATDTLIEYISFGSPIWQQIYVLQSDDYRAMEQSHDNFNSKDNALARIPTWLNLIEKPYASEGDVQVIQYSVSEKDSDGNRVTKDYVTEFNYKNKTWVAISDTQAQTGAYKWDNETKLWNVSPVYTFVVTTDDKYDQEYTVTAADYTSVGESYANFDGRNNTQEDIDTKIGTILNSQSEIVIEEGQNIKVNYVVYDGGANDKVGYYKATLP